MRLLTSRPWRTLNPLNPIASPKALIRPRHRRQYSSSGISKPLRILFAGSDEFSCASLRAIHAEHLRNPKLIASIDVLHQPPKKAGRGQIQLRFVPIIALARELGIPTHTPEQCWTPEKLTLPTPGNEPINLIIAVSFGLFIPRRLLEAVEYGGLNIHPSLLPNYRGAAPLQHAIINNSKKTGITLQTLSPKSFDHGVILSQTPPIPIAHSTTYPKLLEEVTPKAASLLLSGLKAKLYIPPLVDISPYLPDSKRKLRLAPKITSRDSEINWEEWGAEHLVRRQNALGRLWSTIWKPVVPIPPLSEDHVPSKKVHNFTYPKKEKPRHAHLIFQPHFEILSRERVSEILRNTRKEASSVKEFKVYETLFSNPSDAPLETSKKSDNKEEVDALLEKALSDLSTSSSSSSSPTNTPNPPEPPLQKIHWFNNGQAAVFMHKGQYLQVAKLILGGQPIGNAREVLLPFSRRVCDLWNHSLESNERFLGSKVGEEVVEEQEEDDWEDDDGGRYVRRVKAG